ncbi:mannose-1-phosphate guanylyltransferase/mannose-6-phosphate isomerase [Geothermobacter hydrogeniphilus]|uniref:mannose-1-phosphate guanylyltransferase n=1 Tax=Geothermobacter hydrogeniphilus TaxID=1969733 RepID=A0A1X0XIW7_9BACT|nr:mannose-1-phosphate guanylyltransferase/mannose-6-phosphate isomerase [Geothermobacter hydrogeniphilus]ORJ52859.1 mannose-1-phosphate guanylyltransferase/mannose-6-phosphate isomerase [Geothermobacter hydrogeniphilus]
MILPVILSGGAGTRLWPLSRELYPKQLLPLCGEQTMLQQTAARLDGLTDIAAPLVICNEAHRFLVAEQLRADGCGHSGIILEPVGRNTAPAVAVAALRATADGDDPLLLILPADHVIADIPAFQAAVEAGRAVAGEGQLVTFGIVPDRPETGYGYIRAGEPLEWRSEARGARREEDRETGAGEMLDVRCKTQSQNHQDTSHISHLTSPTTACAVAAFVEKPDAATAQSYLDAGGYYWNSGMFLFRASVYLEELEKFNPGMLAACRAAHGSLTADLDFLRLGSEAFAACPADSIDYAVMEKTENAAVIPLSAGWNDVGSFSALWEVGEQDAAGNVCHGDVLTEDARGCLLHAGSRMIAAVGTRDLVVVETADAVLVADKGRVQEVKQIVSRLKEEQRGEALLHRRVNRPWGAYEGVDAGERFQVKRITVNPGASLSLQKHHHRAEHWIVVSGTARVTCGDQVLTLTENQSTYIPLGEVHRLENPGQIPLQIIEVQSGSYLGEDDIVRIEDDYGR